MLQGLLRELHEQEGRAGSAGTLGLQMAPTSRLDPWLPEARGMVYLAWGGLTLGPDLGPRCEIGMDLSGMTRFRSEGWAGKNGVKRLSWGKGQQAS